MIIFTMEKKKKEKIAFKIMDLLENVPIDEQIAMLEVIKYVIIINKTKG